MSYGEKIASLRRSKGMTQAALGAELNVTYQAVSKWERDESDPDFATMCKLAKLFGVPLAFFENAEVALKEPEATVEAAPAETAPERPEQRAMIGVCTSCGRTLYEGDAAEGSPVLVCKPCVTRKAEAAARAANEQKERRARAEAYERAKYIKRRNRGLIASAFITGALLIAVIVGAIASEMNAGLAVAGVFGTLIFFYPFIAQLFWDGFIVDVVLAGVKVVGTPGVIFTLDLDGIIFLIAVKILFMFVKIILFFLIFIFMFFVAIILSPFAFFPQFISLTRGNEL